MRRLVAAVAVVAAACTTTTVDPTSTVPTPAGSVTVPPSGDPTPSSEPSGGLVCWQAQPPETASEGIDFADVSQAVGLIEPLTGMHAHAAAWGDVNGDDWPDVVVGTFANRPVERYQVRGADGPRADTLLLGGIGGFEPVPGFPEVLGRTSGAAIVDLDNDGDNDIVLSRNMRDRERGDAPTQIYRNDGGDFVLVDLDLGRLVSGRSIGILDFDRDGLLDVLLLEDRFAGNRSTRLLRNDGDMRFEDATEAAGLPVDLHGLGVATSDLNGDGATDFFIGGSNRLFIADGDRFVEATSPDFAWETFGNEDDVAGVSIGDLNRDGMPDLVVGHHYNSTLSQDRSVPIRVYLNEGVDEAGLPMLRDITAESGIGGLPTKAPHVEIADFDNDGWPDILTTASAAGGTRPAIFRNTTGGPGATPSFDTPAGLGSAQYWVSGPTADVDRDGRVDVLLVEWEPTLPSLMLQNQSRSGNWLEVSLGIAGNGIGTRIWVWEAGGAGDDDRLLGMREIVVTQGYTGGGLPVAHFGLGDVARVDVRAITADGTVYEALGQSANAHLRFPAGCP